MNQLANNRVGRIILHLCCWMLAGHGLFHWHGIAREFKPVAKPVIKSALHLMGM